MDFETWKERQEKDLAAHLDSGGDARLFWADLMSLAAQGVLHSPPDDNVAHAQYLRHCSGQYYTARALGPHYSAARWAGERTTDDTPPEYTCPVCGGHQMPAAWVAARKEWFMSMTDGERGAARELLAAFQLHGLPEGRAWVNAFWDTLRALCPFVVQALGDLDTRPGDFLPIFPDD